MSIPNEQEKGKFAKVKKWHPPDVLEAEKAIWNKSNTEQFLQCVINEIINKNRVGQQLTLKGYNGVSKSFYELTGKFYDKQQFKNKYDSLKRDWIAWNQLRGQTSTGLGWDPEKKTYTAPDHWWDKMIAINANCLKFQKGGLENEELLDQIFGKTSATGKTQWTPGEDFQTENGIDEDTINLDDDDFPDRDYGDNNQSQFEIKQEDNEYGNGSGKKRKSSKRQATTNEKKKKSTSGMLQETISSLVEVIQNRGNEMIVKQHSDIGEATIPICLKKLAELRHVLGDKLFILGTKLMTKPAEREVFMNLEDDDTRIMWLQSFD